MRVTVSQDLTNDSSGGSSSVWIGVLQICLQVWQHSCHQGGMNGVQLIGGVQQSLQAVLGHVVSECLHLFGSFLLVIRKKCLVHIVIDGSCRTLAGQTSQDSSHQTCGILGCSLLIDDEFFQ